MLFMVEPSQFSVVQPAQSLTCYIVEKLHTGLDDSLRMLMLLSCFRKRMSGQRPSIIQRKVSDDPRTSFCFMGHRNAN